MGDARDPIIRPRQKHYLDGLKRRPDATAVHIERYAAEHGLVTCRPSTARLLAIVARASRAGRIVEVGSGLGRGTMALAGISRDVRVTSIDRDGGVLAEARRFLADADLADRVDWIEGEAADVLPGLEGSYDLAFLDVDKKDDRRCLDLALMRLRVGGMVVIDHLLWGGRVAEPGPQEDEAAEAAYAFNGYFSSHPQLSSLVLPVDDGVGLAVKLQPLVTDVGGPF